LARLAARRHEFPDLAVESLPLRRYPWGQLAAHSLGHLGEVDEAELERRLQTGEGRLYAPGDIIGKRGIERIYDAWLFGTKGRERYRVDAGGRVVELLNAQAPRPGWDLKLALDLTLQQTAEQILADRRGAIVAVDPRNGGVRALASRPSFDPTLFVGGIGERAWRRLRDDPRHPLEFRPVRGVYPPGSTIKPFVAVAALAEGVIEPDEEIHCPGYYRVGRRRFRCWKAAGHGNVDLYDAIVESCDTYFYEIGRRLGIEKLAEWFRHFGFGARTGVDLDGEKTGLVPDPAWKRRRTDEPWQGGETVITAIGQGSLLATPLQLAHAYALLLGRGRAVPPHLRAGFLNTGRPAPPRPPKPRAVTVPALRALPSLAPVTSALEGVVQDRDGTGRGAALRTVDVGGKTGTAQVVRQAERGEELEGTLRDHAWFVGYAPVADPELIVVVLLEHGGSGGRDAAPVARALLRSYFEDQTP